VTATIDAYFICATPRSGSTLLCGLLASTGVAGHPESYFRAADIRTWATIWGIVDERGGVDFPEFVQRARLVGATGNGVFACRMMWGTLEEVVDGLRVSSANWRGDDLDVLRRAFGELRFVYLTRGDVLAQAVSWARAEQTDVWHEAIGGSRTRAHSAPSYERAHIDELVATIEAHNHAWHEWFANVGVRPHEVHYETLEQSPSTTVSAVLAALGLEVDDESRIQVRHRLLRDEVNAAWIERYRSGS
jgi:LPS sulfotransferase NodH